MIFHIPSHWIKFSKQAHKYKFCDHAYNEFNLTEYAKKKWSEADNPTIWGERWSGKIKFERTLQVPPSEAERIRPVNCRDPRNNPTPRPNETSVCSDNGKPPRIPGDPEFWSIVRVRKWSIPSSAERYLAFEEGSPNSDHNPEGSAIGEFGEESAWDSMHWE